MRQQVSRLIHGIEYSLERCGYGFVVLVLSPLSAIRAAYCLLLCAYHYCRRPEVSWQELEWFMFVELNMTHEWPDKRWVWNSFNAKELTPVEKERYYRIKHTLEHGGKQ